MMPQFQKMLQLQKNLLDETDLTDPTDAPGNYPNPPLENMNSFVKISNIVSFDLLPDSKGNNFFLSQFELFRLEV